MKRILLLGASGSIGTQTIDILRENKDKFVLVGVSVGHNIECLEKLLNEFKSIKFAYAIDTKKAYKLILEHPEISFYSDNLGLKSLVQDCDADIVVNALVGFAGLAPSVIALEKNEILALANKESLVVGGDLINSILESGKGKIWPIDSEHVALKKCIDSVEKKEIKTLFLTASGGSFRNLSRDELKNVTVEDALNHPTWSMGKKITIDCATMMNKGFEVMEAYHLYHFPLENYKIVMHKESLVHSGIILNDNKILYDFSKPDMHNPIEYAIFEGKKYTKIEKIDDLNKISGCSFAEFNPDRYPCVGYAIKALQLGGCYGAVLNAANEVAVNAFLKNEISFLDIEKIIEKNISNFDNIITKPSLEDLENVDEFTRIKTKEMILRKDY